MTPDERSRTSGPALPEEELAAFEALLRAAAPRPAPALTARVGREVQAALRQRATLTAVREGGPGGPSAWLASPRSPWLCCSWPGRPSPSARGCAS